MFIYTYYFIFRPTIFRLILYFWKHLYIFTIKNTQLKYQQEQKRTHYKYAKSLFFSVFIYFVQGCNENILKMPEGRKTWRPAGKLRDLNVYLVRAFNKLHLQLKDNAAGESFFIFFPLSLCFISFTKFYFRYLKFMRSR